MKKIQKILIPVDFSPEAYNAIRYAAGIMEKHLSEVVMVYVNTPENFKGNQEIEQEFKVFEAEVLQDTKFNYSFEILNGELLSELVKATRLFLTDLVIIGSKGKRTSNLSLASSLIRAAYCPVIVVPEEFTSHQIRRIAYGNDFKPMRDSLALKPLWEFVLEFRAKVFLLHVGNKKKEALVPADDMENSLEYYLESLDHEYVYLSGDDVEQTISDFIQKNEIDLLVILSRDHGNNQLKSEGRLMAQLTAHAQIPVLALC